MTLGLRRTLVPTVDYDDPVRVVHAPHGDVARRSLEITFTGSMEEQREMAEELRSLHRCPNCIEPFPAPPRLENVAVFRDLFAHNPADLREKQLALVARGCCPVCGWEVRGEMVALMDGGTLSDPWKDER